MMKLNNLYCVLSLALTTLALSSCDSTGQPSTPAPVTHEVFFTGGLYVLGGETTQLTFTASQSSNTDTYIGGSWTIEKANTKPDTGTFKVKKKSEDGFVLVGGTRLAANNNAVPEVKVDIDLENMNGEVKGSTDRSDDALVWDLATTPEGENTVIAGVVHSSSDKRAMVDVQVSVTIKNVTGEIDGKLTYLGKTTKLMGYYMPTSTVKIPLAAIAELMIVSVFHTTN